jgi:hypothetical protein
MDFSGYRMREISREVVFNAPGASSLETTLCAVRAPGAGGWIESIDGKPGGAILAIDVGNPDSTAPSKGATSVAEFGYQS